MTGRSSGDKVWAQVEWEAPTPRPGQLYTPNKPTHTWRGWECLPVSTRVAPPWITPNQTAASRGSGAETCTSSKAQQGKFILKWFRLQKGNTDPPCACVCLCKNITHTWTSKEPCEKALKKSPRSARPPSSLQRPSGQPRQGHSQVSVGR